MKSEALSVKITIMYCTSGALSCKLFRLELCL